MGAGDASRSDVERREPVRRSTRDADQRGLWRRPKPGQSICPWNAVAAIVADSARLVRASATARSRKSEEEERAHKAKIREREKERERFSTNSVSFCVNLGVC